MPRRNNKDGPEHARVILQERIDKLTKDNKQLTETVKHLEDENRAWQKLYAVVKQDLSALQQRLLAVEKLLAQADRVINWYMSWFKKHEYVVKENPMSWDELNAEAH